jgi:hypothetical protein
MIENYTKLRMDDNNSHSKASENDQVNRPVSQDTEKVFMIHNSIAKQRLTYYLFLAISFVHFRQPPVFNQGSY